VTGAPCALAPTAVDDLGATGSQRAVDEVGGRRLDEISGRGSTCRGRGTASCRGQADASST